MLVLVFAQAALAGWTVVDDFENHPEGSLRAAPEPWIVEAGGEAFRIAAHASPVPGKHLEIVSLRDTEASLRHREFALPSAGPAVSTLFVRMQYSGNPSARAFVHLALARKNDPERLARAFEWRLSYSGEVPKLSVVRSEGHGSREAIAEVAADTWLSFWAVIRSSDRSYSLYVAPDDAPGATAEHRLIERGTLRSTTPIEVLRILAQNTPRPATVRVDDLYVDRTGENLSRPGRQSAGTGAPAPSPKVNAPPGSPAQPPVR